MKQTRREDNKIWELLRSQPEEGLRLAMEQYGGAVKWIAANILGADARQDVEECVAETFVRLWRGSTGFNPDGSADFDPERWTAERQNTADRSATDRSTLYSYTCGIARHVAIDMVRRRRMNHVSMEEMTEDVAAELAEDPDFAKQLADQENRRILWETVEQLPPPDREIFLLRYWMELRVNRIGEILGLTEKQVENRLYRGRRTLRKTLEERGIIR